MNMKLSERQVKILQFIAEFIHRHNYPPTIREIGKAVGISSTSVVKYNLTKLENEGFITREKEVSRGLSLNWDLLVERGLIAEIPGGGVFPEAGRNGAGREAGHAFEFIRIPILGPIAAGEPIQVSPAEEWNAEEWIELTQVLVPNTDKLFALRVRGDSMIDAGVLDGDIVVLRHQETAEVGEMVAAWIEGDEETTLKRFRPQGNTVILEPANPDYNPIVRLADKVRINGKVVAVIRRMQ